MSRGRARDRDARVGGRLAVHATLATTFVATLTTTFVATLATTFYAAEGRPRPCVGIGVALPWAVSTCIYRYRIYRSTYRTVY